MTESIRYDLERIGTIFSDIHTYLKDLDNLGIHKREDLSDKRNFYAASMILFSCLNRVIDLGTEISLAHNLGIPSTYREVFVLLKNDGIISETQAQELIGLVTYRNLLSHEYHGITDDKLFRLIQKTAVIREFTWVMQQTIKQHGGESA